MTPRAMRLGVVVPMLSECEALFRRMDFQAGRKVRLWEVLEASVKDVMLGLTVSGTGIINSAIATEALISEWSPDAVFIVGCAGSISPEILPGDVVIGRDIAYYSSYQTLSDGTVNLDLPGIRFRTDYSLNADRTDFAGGQRVRARFIHSSRGLRELAIEAARAAEPGFRPWPDRPGWPRTEGRTKPRCVEAVIGTADQINSDPSVIKVIQDRYGIEVEECEGAAVGQVALSHGVPFIVLRGISDNEVITPVYGDLIKADAVDSHEIEMESTQNVWSLFAEMVKRITWASLTS